LSGFSRSRLPLEDGARAGRAVAERVAAFVRAWRPEAPPALADFLPPPEDPLRRLVLVELIKADLGLRGRHQAPRPLADYLAAFPELPADALPVDLIYEELHQRWLAGESVDAAESLHRYPTQAGPLARLLEQGPATRSTAVSPPAPPPEVRAGDRLDDFDLLAPLGEGTFARVFLAWQRSMARRVALKVSADQGGEGRTLAQLDHPGIVRVFDQRVLPGRGLRLLYMAYVPGGTLQDVLDRLRALPPGQRGGRELLRVIDAALTARNEPAPAEGPFRSWLESHSWPEAVCWLGARLADALDYAHAQGVLHRDIKPANVLLAADGSPLLVDFNIGCCSKLDGAGPAALFGGTLPYMAPEQLEAFNPLHPRAPDSLDGRCDLYSLALTLWELLTGRRPFPGEHLGDDWFFTLTAVTAGRRDGLPEAASRDLPAGCPPGLEAALRRCLAPSPADRFATAGELARELRLCLQPHTRALLQPAPGTWTDRFRRWPLAALLTAGLVPNAVAALLNIAYNQAAIIGPLRDPAAQAEFTRLQIVLNSVLFPLGVAVFVAAAAPVVAGLKRLRAGEALPADERRRRRRRCLRLGEWLAAVSVALWVVAGILFPLLLGARSGALGPGDFLHFVASQTLCGLIAGTLPYFGVNFLAVHALYPAFLRPEDEPSPADVRELNRLGRGLNRFLGLAAMVPLLGVAALAGAGAADRWVLAALSATGLLGFGGAMAMTRRINDDRRALRAAVRPVEEVGG
jgi:serine/threonine protein kinase